MILSYIASLLNVYSFTVYIGSVAIAITALWREIVMLKVHQPNSHSFNNLSESLNHKRLIETNPINLKNAKNRRQRRSDSNSEEEQVRKNNKLFDAILKKNIPTKERMKKIEKALDQGANINAQDKNLKQNTPLHLAVGKGELAVVQFLLEHGADKAIENRDHKTPLMLANGNQPIIDAFNPPQLAPASQQQSLPLPAQPIGGPSSEQYRLALSKTSFTQIDVPADGSCLFWAVALAYLMPVKSDEDALRERWERLFGNEASILDPIKDWLRNYQSTSHTKNPALIQTLVTETLRNRVIDQLASQESKLKETVILDDFVKSQNQDFITTGKFQATFRDEFSAEISQYGVNIHRLKPTILDSADIKSMESELDKLHDLQERVKKFKFRQYLAQMRKTTSWGGHHELQAISQLLGCSIKVFSDDHAPHTINSTTDSDGIHIALYLFNRGEIHYKFGLIKATLLLQAIQDNQSQTAKAYLELGVDDINQQDSEGRSALHFAAQRGDAMLVQLPLVQGARTDSKNLLDTLPLPHLTQRKRKTSGDEEERSQLTKKHKSVTQDEPLPENLSQQMIPTKKRVQAEENNEEMIAVPAKRANAFSNDPTDYKASGLKKTLHGNVYQLKLLMLFLKRGLKKEYAFRLATEMDDAEKFDDLVFQYENTRKDGYIFRFLQAKHKQDEKKKITSSDLLNEKDGYFSLAKYFASYREIKKNPIFVGEKDFILCTNINFNFEELENADIKLTLMTDDDVFFEMKYASKPVARYKLAVNKQHALYKKLMETSETYSLAKTLIERVKNGKTIDLRTSIFKSYHTALKEEKIIDTQNEKFHYDFINDQNLSDTAQNFRRIFTQEALQLKLSSDENSLWKKIENESLKLSDNFGKDEQTQTLPSDDIADDEIEEFLEKLLFAVNQPNEIELGNIITEEIGNDFDLLDGDLMADHLQRQMLDWFKEKGGKFLSHNEGENFLKSAKEKVNKLILIGPTLEYRAKIDEFAIKFTVDSLTKVDDFLSSKKRQILQLITTENTLLSAIKVYQAFVDRSEYKQDDSYLFMRLSKLLRIPERAVSAFGSEKSHHLLVIECKSEAQEVSSLYQKLSAVLTNHAKKIILISQENNAFATHFKTYFKNQIQIEKDDSCFSDLKPDTKNKLLAKEVILQGQPVALSELLGVDDIATLPESLNSQLNTLLDEKTIIQLITSTKYKPIIIDNKPLRLSDLEAAYAKRFEPIEPQNLVGALVETIKAEDSKLFMISGFDPESFNVKQLVDKLIKMADTDSRSQIRSNTASLRMAIVNKRIVPIGGDDAKQHRKEFEELCHNNPHKTIHWISLTDGAFIWQQLYDPKFYVKRKLKKVAVKKTVKTYLLQSEPTDLLVFSGLSKESLYKLIEYEDNGKGKEKKQIEKIFFFSEHQESEAESKFEELIKKQSKKLIHWLKSEGEGKSQQLIIKRSSDDPSVTQESEFGLVSNDKLVIIVDEPGMGKSTTLTRLTEEKIDSSWVIRLNLKDCQQLPEQMNSENVANFLWKEAGGNSGDTLAKGLLSYHLESTTVKSTRLLLVLLDAFDEIQGDNKQEKQEKVIQLLKFLNEKSSAKIWITTRHYPQLEEKLKVLFTTEFEPFNEQQKTKFLRNFWQVRAELLFNQEDRKKIFGREDNQNLHNTETIDNTKFSQYAEALLKRADTVLAEEKAHFIGIPLQIRLLAEGFQRKFEEFAKSEKGDLREYYSDDFKNEVDIYQYFIKAKYDIYFKEKTGLSAGLNDISKDWFIEPLTKRHRRLGFHEIFPEENLALELLLEFKSPFKKDSAKQLGELEELYRIGLVHKKGESSFEFIHRTFAEYFTADLLSNWLSRTSERSKNSRLQEFFLKHILVQSKYKVIRIFLNGHLVKNPPSVNTLNQYGKRIDELWSKGSLYNVKEKTILHIACSEGNAEIVIFLLDSLKDQIETLKGLVLATDEDGKNAFHLAAEMGEVEALKRLWEFGEEKLSPEELKELLLAKDGRTMMEEQRWKKIDGRTAFHLAALSGKIETLKKIWELCPNELKEELLLAKDNNKENAFHLAARMGKVEALEKLWKFGQEKLSPEQLKEEFLLAKDYYRKNAFHLAARMGKVEALEKLWKFYKEKLSLEQLKEELLLAKDNDGRNAFHQAAWIGKAETLEKLWKFGQEKLSPEELKEEFLLAKDNNKENAFHLAARMGKVEALEKLWKFGQEKLSPEQLKEEFLLAKDYYGKNEFHLAAEMGEVEALKRLWEFGEEKLSPEQLKEEFLFAKDNDGQNAFHLAASMGQVEALEKLWKFGQEKLSPEQLKEEFLFAKDNDGQNAFHLAASMGKVEALEKLWKFYKEKLSPEQLKEEFLLAKDYYGKKAFHLAAEMGEVEVLEKLWKFGQEKLSPEQLKEEFLLAKDYYGKNAFHRAAWMGKVEVLEKLWKFGQEKLSPEQLKEEFLLAKDYYGKNAFHLVASMGQVEALEKLWKFGQEKLSPEQLKEELLLAKDNDGRNAFHQAAWMGQVEALEKLWKFGQEKLNPEQLKEEFLFAKDNDGQNAFHLVASMGQVEALEKLWKFYKEKLSLEQLKEELLLAKDNDGRNAFHQAAWMGKVEVLEKLWKFGQEKLSPEQLKEEFLLAKDYYGKNAFHLVASMGQVEALEKLWKFGQEKLSPEQLKEELLLAKDNDGRNAFHQAAWMGKVEVLEKLWKFGQEKLSPEQLKEELLLDKDSDGQNALNLAAQKGYWNIAVALLKVGSNINDLSDEKSYFLMNYVRDSNYENKEYIIQLIKKRQSTTSIEILEVLTELIRNVELEPSSSGGLGGSCISPRKKRHIMRCIDESERFFPYDPLEESIPVTQTHAARIYGQLAMALAWERPEHFSLARAEALDKVLIYYSYLGEIIHEGKVNQSPREQGILAVHYQQAQQFLSNFPENQLLKKVTNSVVDLPPSQAQSPLAYLSWIFENGQHSLLVLFNDGRYQIYSQDFNYRKRFQTGDSVPYSQIEAFARAFFKWLSGSDFYTRYRLVEHLPSTVISHLQNALLWTPEQVASDRVLLENQPLTEIEGLPLDTISQMVRLAGQVPDLTALHPDFFQQQAHGIQLNVEALHHLLPTLTATQCQALVTLVKKYEFSADTTAVNALSIDERPLLRTYQGKVLDELKSSTTATITPERLSELSWQTLSEEFDKHPDISPELKQQVLTTTQQIHATAAKRAWAKGMATQTLFFLPDMIRAANTGQVRGLAMTAGMLATDGTINSLYGRLVEHLAPTLSETRVALLQKLPVTSPVFKALTVYSIVELTQQLNALPANSAQRQIIQHRLGEQCITAGLMVAELLGFEVTPLWIGLIAEQLIFEAITFRKENQLDIPFWETFLMSLGFEQNKLRDIFEERQLVEVNLATVDRLNTQAMPAYGWTVVKVPLIGNVEWQDIAEQQIPESIKQQVMKQPAPFSLFVKEQRTREAVGFRQIQRYAIKLVVGSRGMAVAVRGALLETRWQRGNYPAQPAAVKVQFIPGDSSYQEDNIFLDTPAGELTNYRRIAAVTGADYKQWVSNSPVQIRGPGLAALYANNHTFSDINGQRNLYLGFDPREGDITLELTTKGLERLDEINRAHNPHYLINYSLPYIVTLQVGNKPYPESILLPQQGGLLLLKDSSRRVNSHYFVSSDSSPFRIRDDAIATRIAFTRTNTNTTGYLIRSDGPEIMQMQVEQQDANNASLTNLATIPLFSTLWLKGHKKYLQLMLQHQIIDGTLTLAADRLEILYAKGKTAAHSSLEMRPSVLTFAVTVMGHLRVTHAANTLQFIGARPTNATPIGYAKPLSASYGTFYQLKIVDLRSIINSLSRNNASDMDFSTPELRYRWQPNTVDHTPLKITGLLNGQAACLTLEQNSTTLTFSDHYQQPTGIEVAHYIQQAVLDNRLVLQQIVTPPPLNSSEPGHYQLVADAQIENRLLVLNIISSGGAEDILLFQAPQGYPVAHRFPNSDKITLNDIDYQIQGNTLYAIGAKNNVITNEKLIRTQGAKCNVAIRFTTPLSHSQLALDKGSLSINHLTLRHLPERTLVYFDQEAFPLKALQDTLQRPTETQPLPSRQRRDLPSDTVTSSAQRPAAWPTSVFKSVSTLLVGMLSPWLQHDSGPSTSSTPVLTLTSESTPQTPKTTPTLLELGDQWLAQANHQGLLQLLDLVVRKCTAQKYPQWQAASNCSQPAAQAQAAGMVDEFNRNLNHTALTCGIKPATINNRINLVKLQQQVAQKLYANQIEAIPALLNQTVQQIHQQIKGIASQKQADRFLARFDNIPTPEVDIGHLRQQMVSTLNDTVGVTARVFNKIDALPSS